MATPRVPTARSSRSTRLGLRATPEQEAVLRRAAEAAHKSLTDFILESACRAAEQTLLDQRLFMVSDGQYQALLDLLDRPAGTIQACGSCFPSQSPGMPGELAWPRSAQCRSSAGNFRLWQTGAQ